MVCFAIVVSTIIPSQALAHAAAPSPFTVIGDVTEVLSPQAYVNTNAAFVHASNSPLPLKLDHARYFVVHGTPIGPEHPYSYRIIADPGTQVGIMELAVNQKQATHLIEVGTLAGTSSAVQPYASGSHTFGFQTIWEDPVGASVNWVDSHLNFSYNGSYVTINSTWYTSWWLSNTGWSQTSASNWSAYTDRGTVAWSITNAHMHNGSFWIPGCSPPTDVYYNNNNALGYANGNIGGTVYTYATGSCAGLLDYYSLFTTP
jgi:hypothetical protein